MGLTVTIEREARKGGGALMGTRRKVTPKFQEKEEDLKVQLINGRGGALKEDRRVLSPKGKGTKGRASGEGKRGKAAELQRQIDKEREELERARLKLDILAMSRTLEEEKRELERSLFLLTQKGTEMPEDALSPF